MSNEKDADKTNTDRDTNNEVFHNAINTSNTDIDITDADTTPGLCRDADGLVTEAEFMAACASDTEMMKLLTPNVSSWGTRPGNVAFMEVSTCIYGSFKLYLWKFQVVFIPVEIHVSMSLSILDEGGGKRGG